MNELITSNANLHKSHQMLRGHARKFDFSSFALFQNWYSFLLCSDLWILLLGLTNKTCSLQVFRVTSKANLPKSHQMLRGHACKFDFSSFALFQNWYSFLLCSDLWILLLGLTNKTCSLQVFRVIRGKLEWQETIPGPWIIAQNYFCSLTENLFSTSPFFRRALVGLCVFSSLDSHILAVTRTPGVL